MTAPEDAEWKLNYFSYFTEVEEHFQRARGTGLFLMSPLDWALVESWKNAGVPLEAVLRGIDAAFEKWRARRQRAQRINSLAYCAQAVMQEAEAMARNQAGAGAAQGEAGLALEAVRHHIEKGAAALAALDGFGEIAASLRGILDDFERQAADLRELELRLTALEDKMASIARTRLSEERLLEMRRELERDVAPYRSRMSAEQLARLEKSFLDRKVYEAAGLPRLSLFYL
jgi:DNA repair exonuclease SbcCD ATPase subunit